MTQFHIFLNADKVIPNQNHFSRSNLYALLNKMNDIYVSFKGLPIKI